MNTKISVILLATTFVLIAGSCSQCGSGGSPSRQSISALLDRASVITPNCAPENVVFELEITRRFRRNENDYVITYSGKILCEAEPGFIKGTAATIAIAGPFGYNFTVASNEEGIFRGRVQANRNNGLFLDDPGGKDLSFNVKVTNGEETDTTSFTVRIPTNDETLKVSNKED